jgi:hypothetical protein
MEEWFFEHFFFKRSNTPWPGRANPERDMSSLALDGLLRKYSNREEHIVGRDVEPAVGLRVR